MLDRDDLIADHEYSVSAHHDEEHGKQIRKKIYFVTALLSIITTIEVVLGVFVTERTGITWETVKWTFIILTLVKAGYIVLVFMHLGDERKSLKWTILAPYLGFIVYLIFILLTEADYTYDVLHMFD